VRIIAPFAAGGGVDVLARLVSQRLAARLGQPFIVENRPGAGGNVGTEYAAKASADGYTLLLGGVPQAISMSLYAKSRIAYDFSRDFAPVGAVASFPSIIVVHPSVPARTVTELVALAKRHPGELSYGSAGQGSPNQLAIELLGSLTGVKMVHVPYKSSGQVAIDLVAGNIQLASMGLPVATPHLTAGRLRALAITSTRRARSLPNLPTMDEAGIHGFDVTSWYGVFAPAGTPREIVSRLASEVAAMAQAPDIVERLNTLGATPESATGEAYARYVRDEVAKWAKVVKSAGAKAD
jgi:tripartite-type tricarboxylate transporter receptor subunit TctC